MFRPQSPPIEVPNPNPRYFNTLQKSWAVSIFVLLYIIQWRMVLLNAFTDT
ncbi:uncharacterized protein DEA37_0003394 [Paragonimus westermani]|uniref:Uncharacterized protein n=1 Tax=Paragonimus westermani TaxID=34504 RepID=A0A5J4NHB5_9TREM|nr:uncharacterized protein DEA37_0003394 [Paragonimus westermani]